MHSQDLPGLDLDLGLEIYLSIVPLWSLRHEVLNLKSRKV